MQIGCHCIQLVFQWLHKLALGQFCIAYVMDQLWLSSILLFIFSKKPGVPGSRSPQNVYSLPPLLSHMFLTPYVAYITGISLHLLPSFRLEDYLSHSIDPVSYTQRVTKCVDQSSLVQQNTWYKQVKKKDLFWFMCLEVAIHHSEDGMAEKNRPNHDSQEVKKECI